MAKSSGSFKKGVSGNPKGRPKGTGPKQRNAIAYARQTAADRRLNQALALTDAWFEQRLQILMKFVNNADSIVPDYSVADILKQKE